MVEVESLRLIDVARVLDLEGILDVVAVKRVRCARIWFAQVSSATTCFLLVLVDELVFRLLLRVDVRERDVIDAEFKVLTVLHDGHLVAKHGERE